jgi:hypothetical protein
MKSIFLIIGTIFLSFLAQAQNEFAPLGAKWTYSTSSAGLSFIIEPTSLEVVEEKIINGKKMKRLQSEGYKGCAGFTEWIYEEKGKVYQYINLKSYLLYDFNAKTGDSLKIVFNTPSRGLDSAVVRIDSVSTINTLFGIKKVQHLERVGILGYKGDFQGDVIEGIGNIKYFFPSFGLCDATPYGMRCYTENSITTKFVTYDCDKIINTIKATTEEQNDVSFAVFPNPTNGQLSIQSEVLPNVNCIWQLFDTQGKQVFLQQLQNGKTSLELPPHLPQGIYFWHVLDGVKQLQQGKILLIE